MKTSTGPDSLGAWPTAVRLVARWLDRRERIDLVLESAPLGMDPAERGRCQNLVFGVVRHFQRIESALSGLVAHPPRFGTRAILYIAGYELIETGQADGSAGRIARIVHHAVAVAKEVASPAEAGLVNAVSRRLARILSDQREPPREARVPLRLLADYYSHPEWLIRRWTEEYGPAATRLLLEWNQAPAPLYGRWRDPATVPPEWLLPTDWTGFYAVPQGRWKEVEGLIRSGALYLQDPGTRLAPQLLDPKPGETVLDLCAAPGGKGLFLADLMGSGRLVAVDLPGERIGRLTENLSRVRGVDVALVQADLLRGLGSVLKEHRLPTQYSAIMLDVPCSNTGVMRHRIDVRWRLLESDFAKHGRQQVALLSAAALLLKRDGRIVYSTCSIDPAENEKVVKSFLARERSFTLVNSVSATPWSDRHDGAAAFLLRRS